MPVSLRTSIFAAFAGLLALSPANAQGLFVNPFEEKPMGIAQHPSFLAEGGGPHPNRAFSAYVGDVGMRLARVSAKYPDAFVFTTLNSSSFNAFNSLGGFVYVYAGIIPWMNDESELAALLGHEIGHAVKRHVAHGMNRRAVADRMIALSVLRGRSQSTIEDKRVRAELIGLEFSREQEYEADDNAFTATQGVGYDPSASARMLNALVLRRQIDKLRLGDGYKEGPSFLDNHPPAPDRVRRALSHAQGAGGTGTTNRDQFLDMLDGFTVPASKLTLDKPTRVRVVKMQSGQSPEALAAQMLTAPRLKLPLLLAMNGLSDPSELRAGARIKLLVAR
ncbi:MAG: M48 family metalloprotease [Pseudomonadota bacterium]